MKLRGIFFRLVTVILLLCATGCSGLRSGGLPSSGSGADRASPTEGYCLQIGDQIDLQVYREPQLSGTFRVDGAGQIRHPLFGSFKVDGLTTDEAEQQLTRLLDEKYLVNPKVIVSIVSAQSSHVVILGEVKTPGVHPIPFGESITLLQAIAEAGGFSDLASVDRVTVTRTVNGKETSIRVRVSRIVSGGDPDMKLEPNDVIMVPQVIF